MGRATLLAAALALVTAVVFHGVLDGEFVDWDDGLNVAANPGLNPASASSVLGFWKAPYLKLYIPLTYTAWAAITPLARTPARTETGGWGPLAPRPFHAPNLALHVAAAVAVFSMLRRLFGCAGPAFCGALLFALHPVQVEPVAWVTGMKDVLGGALAIAAIWQYLSFAAAARVEEGESPPTMAASAGTAPAARGRAHFALASLLFVLALLAKPSAAAVPLIAWCLDRWALGRSAREATWSLLPWGAVALAWAAVTARAQPPGAIDFVPSAWGRLVVAGDALAFYLGKLAWPTGLAIDYGRSPATVLSSRAAPLAWLLPGGVAIAAWLLRRRAPWLLAGLGVFIAALLPVLGIIPFEFQNQSTVADRYLYVALLGPAVALAGTLRGGRTSAGAAGAIPSSATLARPRPVLITAVAALLIVALGTMSLSQVPRWRTTRALFARALAVNPRSAVAHNLYGMSLVEEGRVDEGLMHFAEALRLRPRFPEAHYHRGLALIGLGRAAEAESAFAEAIRIRPNFSSAHNNLGVALARQGRLGEAIASYERALAIQPGDPQAHTNLGNALAKEGRVEEARAQYEAALSLRPDSPEALSNLGALLAGRGDLAGATALLERAARASPASADVRGNLGMLLVAQGRAAEALPHFDAALRGLPSSWELHRGHARALAAAGRPDEARAAYMQARALNPALPVSDPQIGASNEDGGRPR